MWKEEVLCQDQAGQAAQEDQEVPMAAPEALVDGDSIDIPHIHRADRMEGVVCPAVCFTPSDLLASLAPSLRLFWR